MTILFTTDIDRTLVFSKRLHIADTLYRCIETLDGQHISYASEKTLMQLELLQKAVKVVPVTTRSIRQYERLTLFQQERQPHIAIVANGGIILRDGQIDTQWQAIIKKEMEQLPLHYEQLPQLFHALFTAPFVQAVHEVEQLFFMLKMKDSGVQQQEVDTLCEKLAQNGWTYYLQERKLYVLPQFLTKGRAVQYIKQANDWHIAAGDSLMDMSMLVLANEYFIPKNSELAQHSDRHQLLITQEASSHFTEYMLDYLLQQIAVERSN